MVSAPALNNEDDKARGSVEIRSVSGKLLGRVQACFQEKVGSLKRRVLTHVAEQDVRAWGHSVLVHGLAVLQDNLRLCESLQEKDEEADLLLTLVRPAPSTMASRFTNSEDGDCFGEDSGIAELADSVFRAEHAVSEKHLPDASAAAAAIEQESRIQVVAWLGMACEATQLDDSILHGAVIILDRYAAAGQGSKIELHELSRLSLAALCTVMKLANADEISLGYLQRVLQHLSQGREKLSNILRTEVSILRRLGFEVGTPPITTFLNGLSMRLGGAGGGPRCRTAALQVALARLLAELALYDAQVAYSWPLAVLAAGALGVGFFALLEIGSEDRPDLGPVDLPALQAEHCALLDDLSGYCPNLLGREGALRDCEERLLSTWQAYRSGAGRHVECFQVLLDRHVRRLRAEARNFGDLGAELRDLSPEVGLQRYRLLYSDHQDVHG